jgi:hypothetical protein
MATVSKRDLTASLEELATGLFALEVNTILKANMTGERWSTTDRALADVRDEYAAKLVDLGARDAGASFGGEATADQFGVLLDDAGKAMADAKDGSDYLMLARVHDSCETIQRIIRARAADPKKELSVDDFVTLRKIWEIGTEEIVMQTVIHLDGDVMTRVQPHWAGPEGQGVLAIHNTSVTTATSYWKLLVDTLRAFVGGVVSLVK